MEAAMERFGVPSDAVKWTVALLKSRQVKAKNGDESVTITGQKGCPQRGVLSSPVGDGVWWLKVEQTAAKRVQSLQRLACVSITGAMSSCPTLAIKAIKAVLGYTPLGQEVMSTAALSTMKRERERISLFYNLQD
ncbi:hypothetical protein J6590_049064 [Homalodisca vitripennis]|nr:hypothetical protein J6590_049064 [Homalodisca vitripennis]